MQNAKEPIKDRVDRFLERGRERHKHFEREAAGVMP